MSRSSLMPLSETLPALIAPLFAVPESKEARGAVKIVRFQPWDQMVQLEFRNESFAESLQRKY